tara:strand:- start:326 stop:508 length:183 start_codon:yes stop_codon:yes gene_type:complete
MVISMDSLYSTVFPAAPPFFIHLNRILENTIEHARKIIDNHQGPSDSVAKNQVTMSIPAP